MLAIPTNVASQFVIMAAAAALAGLILLAKLQAPAESRGNRTDGVSQLGILLQGAAFAAVSVGHIRHAPLAQPIPLTGFVVAAACAAAALLLFVSSRRALGQNWSLVARTREDHGLVTSGPYARVRHPIYTSLLLLLVSLGAATGHPLQTLLALPLFSLGTLIRIRAEERLLTERFGQVHLDYVLTTPAILPRLS
jgi:protein-S-isoprenylcysteine O-methyltransferase Ste14